MSVIEWKRVDLVNLVQCDDKLRTIKGEITAHCYNAKQKVFCDSLGNAHVFFRYWECVSFQTNSPRPIRLCTVTNDSNLLVTLSQEQDAGVIQLRVFNLNKITKLGGASCIAMAKWNAPQSTATVIEAFDFNGEVYIAIGLEKGDVFLHRGALSRDISSNFRCYLVCKIAITGIAFKPKTNLSCTMFVASIDGVFAYTLCEASDVNSSKVVLDTKSAATQCTAMYYNSSESYFTVGRDDAVYCFTCEDRGPCYAIDGEKSCLAWTGINLLVVVLSKTSQLIVIDIKNKIIILQKKLEPILDVLTDPATCYIITKSKKVYLLQERDLQSKVSLLIERNLHDLANRLLDDAASDDDLGEIYLQYGDHLLATGDVDAAVGKYIKTVGKVDPYCVIRKLLHSRYTKNLAEYLSVLVKTTFATEKHKDLLQNCNNRLELSTKVEQLCSDNNEVDLASPARSDYKISAEIDPTTFLTSISEPSELCKRLRKLKDDQIYDFFIDNGRSLLALHPSEMNVVVKELCSRNGNDNCSALSPERFIAVLMTNSDVCIDFLEHIVRNNSTCSQTIYHFLLELYLREWQRASRDSEDVMRFIRKYNSEMCASNVVILCRNYAFWDGITYLFEKRLQHHLCMRYSIKRRDFQSAMACAEHCADLHIWSQTLSKPELMLDNSSKLNSLLLNMVKEKQQSLLQTLNSIFGNELILVQHIKEFFTQKHHRTLNGCEEQTQVNHVLCEEMQALNTLLRSFFTQPIEFRSSICYICRQQLKFPAVYFLCQHSFHKECIRAYTESNVCVTCSASTKKKPTPENATELSIDKNNHLLEYVAQLLSSGIFNGPTMDRSLLKDVRGVKTITQDGFKDASGPLRVAKLPLVKQMPIQQATTNPFENDIDAEGNTNPFEDYDANLNPFHE